MARSASSFVYLAMARSASSFMTQYTLAFGGKLSTDNGFSFTGL